jgi:hypothetical protein
MGKFFRKFSLSVMCSLMFAVVFGGFISAATGLPVGYVSGGLFAASFIPLQLPQGVVLAGIYKEVWTGEVIKAFQQGIKDTFLDGVRDYSRYVTGDDESQVIHASYFGVEPDVLINNSTYPIPMQELNGTDVPIALDKYQTKTTPVTDDELYALAYDKINLAKQAHADALIKNRLRKAIHAFGPAAHTANTPVLLTTGSAFNGRKRLKWDDIVALRQAYADAGIDIEGLRLVLCADHVNDLLLADTAFQRSYANFKDGVITSQLGFEIREYSANPYYTVASKAKLSFGAVPGSTDKQASVCFPVQKAGKASGKTLMYYSEAKTDPDYQRNKINFRNYFIALPLVTKGFSAVVSDVAA